jgi:hypothetical protein
MEKSKKRFYQIDEPVKFVNKPETVNGLDIQEFIRL